MAVVIVTPPATEPVSVAEARAHLRVDTSEDDAMLARLIKAGREWVESRLGVALISRRVRETLTMREPPCVSLAIKPATLLYSARWLGADGAWIASPTQSVTLLPSPSASHVRWSTAAPPIGATVEIEYQCGLAEQADATPAALRQAILIWVGASYAQREGQQEHVGAIEALLAPFGEARL